MKRLLLISTICLFATSALADNLNQSGVGNVAQQNVGNNYGPSGTNAGGSIKNTLNSSNSQHQSQVATGGRSSSSANNAGNSQSVNNEAQKRNPVSTAFAAPLVAAEDTCMGSSSVGGQGVGFGLSVGSTWRDADCVRRKDARELHNMGEPGAALALLCQSADVAAAMKAAGKVCPGVTEVSTASTSSGHHLHVANGDVTYVYPTSAKVVKW